MLRYDAQSQEEKNIELRIHELEEKVSQMHRSLEDLIYNIDEDNFTAEFKSTVAKLKALLPAKTTDTTNT